MSARRASVAFVAFVAFVAVVAVVAGGSLTTFRAGADVADPGDGAVATEPVPLSWADDAPVLGIGASGAAVTTWQSAMNTWLDTASPESTFRLDVDGVYGRLTDSTTRRFQHAQGIPVDGLVGPVTRAAFLSAPELVAHGLTPVAHEPSLAPGDHGDAVAAWQTALNRWIAAAGAPTDALAVDGIYGPVTTRATEVLQGAQGVTVDGLAGPETRAALASAPALVNVSPSAPVATTSRAERPAAGICSSSDTTVAVLELGPDVPTPRCLAMSADHPLRIVDAGGATHVTIGSWELDLDAGATVTSPLPIGAYVELGDHVLDVARYGGSGPDVRVR